MTVSWARRLAVAPERNVVSRAAVVSTWSATSAIGERGKLVMATVVAPCRRASASTSIVSMVSPVCETPIATSPGPSSAALVSAMCTSGQANTALPIRWSFCCRSSATQALAPTP